MIRVTVLGRPAPQGSKRAVGKDKKGRTILVESSKGVKPWRDSVAWGVADKVSEPLTGPLRLSIAFYLPRPKSAKRGALPTTYPDLSKLIRATEDALVDGGLIADDKLIVEYGPMLKRYSGDGFFGNGAVITIEQIGVDTPATV